jgi:hypothetical protein
MSTSIKRVEGFHEHPAPGKVFFEIQSRTGVDIKAYSKFKKEEEILFLPKSVFMIQDVSTGASGETVVKMTELH